MTHFQDDVTRTRSPEDLSRWEKVSTLVMGVQFPRPLNGPAPNEVETVIVESDEGILLEVWKMRHPVPRARVLLFHGYGGFKSAMLGEARALHDLGCTVWLVDFRAHGGSNGDVTSLGLQEANDVAAVVRAAEAAVPGLPLVLHGQSMGAAAILRAIAHQGVQPDGIILEACFDRLLSTVKNRFHAMGLPAFPLAHLLLFWGGMQVGSPVTGHNPVVDAARFAGPALVLHGSRDPRATVAEGKNVFDALPGQKVWVEFETAGHESYVSHDRSRWTAAVDAFFTSMELHREPRL